MKHLKAAGQRLALYLDDLQLLAGGACFVRAAWELGGRPAAQRHSKQSLTKKLIFQPLGLNLGGKQ